MSKEDPVFKMLELFDDGAFSSSELLMASAQTIGELSTQLRPEVVAELKGLIAGVARKQGVTGDFLAFGLLRFQIDRYFEILNENIAAHGCHEA